MTNTTFQGICVGGPLDREWRAAQGPHMRVMGVPELTPVGPSEVPIDPNEKIKVHEYVYEAFEFCNADEFMATLREHPTWRGKIEIWRHVETYADRYALLVGLLEHYVVNPPKAKR